MFRDEGSTGLRLSRRYWGDEMSSCIEIYCLHLLNSASYLPCLQKFCPDAVVSYLSKRSEEPGDVELASSLSQGEVDTKFVSCPAAGSRSKYCIGFVCRHVFTGGVESTLDRSTSPVYTIADTAPNPYLQVLDYSVQLFDSC